MTNFNLNINSDKSFTIAKIAVEGAAYSFDILFDYYVPDTLLGKISPGVRVLVPFGKGGRKLLGMVFQLINEEEESQDLKYILKIIDENPVISEEQRNLVLWLKRNTFCTYFEAIKSILPGGLGVVVTADYIFKKPKDYTSLNESEILTVKALETLKNNAAKSRYISDIERLDENYFNTLLSKGIIIKSEGHKKKSTAAKSKMICLKMAKENGDYGMPFTPKQKAVMSFLTKCESASVKEICYNAAVTPAVINNLVKQGHLTEHYYEVSHSPLKDAVAQKPLTDIILSQKQQIIFDELNKIMSSNNASCTLLRGVTGSGKTSIFIRLIHSALKEEKTALMLVPEIALTPQMTDNFTKLFGNKVAIIHSGLTLRQRVDEYKRIKEGKAQIVVGTRSAVFAPLSNIGIIVVDEEGERSYKSDVSPRYHVREVAKQRVIYHKALLLLASATPSIESYHFAKTGRYELLELEERYSKAILPDVYIVDMKVESELGNKGNFSEVLLNEISLNLSKGEQSIILLNRRGYHTYANCIACCEAIKCPTCEIALTYHKINDTVQCHYCGYNKKMPNKCDKCGSSLIRQSGTGTQRVEEELTAIFPGARILRMDADTVMSKNAYEKNFKSFANGDYDIMLGTQMIAKGLDFENVTLVGVLLIDKALHIADYMGYERTFSLVTQVVGRSGRGSKKGRAYIQTYSPDHYVLELAAAQNYREFYEQEIDVRKALIFPPFCDIFLIGFVSSSEEKGVSAAKRFIEIFRESFKDKTVPIRLLGPTKNGVGRINGKYRQKILIKTKNTANFRRTIEQCLNKASKDADFKNVSLYVDINGDIL